MPFAFLGKRIWFPNPETASGEGIVAIGGDLEPERLTLAYRSGIFPWYSEDQPIIWWSPNPRFVLYPNRLKIQRSLRKIIKKGLFEIRFDTAFEQVIRACAGKLRPHQDGTWITSSMEAAYIAFHKKGFAHSVEVFSGSQLVGGLYGVAMGRFFFGESMFYNAPNASKVALAALVDRYRHARFIDCQVHNAFFESMGAEHIQRKTFLGDLRRYVDGTNIWQETKLSHPGGKCSYLIPE